MSENYNLKSRSAKNLRADSFHHIDFICEDPRCQPSHMPFYGAYVKAPARKKHGRAGQETNHMITKHVSTTWRLKVCRQLTSKHGGN